MRLTKDKALILAEKIYNNRYKDAAVVFLAGSIIRNEATKFSDLDLVVVYEEIDSAFRESFYFEGTPVEAFVHDPETLNYFFMEVDRKSGFPSLPQMVVEGIEIPIINDFSEMLKSKAKEVIDFGPPPLAENDVQNRRYHITDLIDDIRDFKSRDELIATGSKLYEVLADFYFRSNQLWSAKGKTIPRRLDAVNSTFAKKYSEAFDAIFLKNDPKAVIDLAGDILNKSSGFFFDGYRLVAPTEWKLK